MSDMIDEIRIGKFHINKRAIEGHPNSVRKLLGEFLIIEADDSMEYRSIEYTAYNEKFDKLEEGNLIPEYEINIEFLEDGDFAWTLKRLP